MTMIKGEFPPNYAHLMREALVSGIPWIADCIVVDPEHNDFRTELRIEIPSVHPSAKEPLVIETAHHQEGKCAPVVSLTWAVWQEDWVLTDPDPADHLAGIVAQVKRFLGEECAAYAAWLQGKRTGGGTVVPATGAPFPVARADRIVVLSWKGTFDRELSGNWPGWPNDSTDAFYNDLLS